MKKILLLTDFSTNAWNAMYTAFKLFERARVQFYVFHGYQPSLPNLIGGKGRGRMAEVTDALAQASKKGLDEARQEIQTNHINPNHSFEYISQPGELIDSIRKMIKQTDMDLMVMGTQGESKAGSVFLGSTAVKVLKMIRNKPILLIPEQFHLQQLRTVLFPTDYLNYYESYEMNSLLDLIELWHPEITVFEVGQEFGLNRNQQINKAQLERLLENFETHFREVLLNRDVAQTISGYAEEKQADLLALIHMKHSFFDRLLREPIVKKMIFSTTVPLLILPDLP